MLLSGEDGSLENDALAEADLQAARWALSTRLSSRADAYPAQNATYDFWPVVTPSRLGAVIGVRLDGRSEGRPGDIERLLDIVDPTARTVDELKKLNLPAGVDIAIRI